MTTEIIIKEKEKFKVFFRIMKYLVLIGTILFSVFVHLINTEMSVIVFSDITFQVFYKIRSKYVFLQNLTQNLFCECFKNKSYLSLHIKILNYLLKYDSLK